MTLVGAALLLAPVDSALSFTTLGTNLSAESGRDFRVHDNFLDSQSDDNTVEDPNFPGWTGLELAFWKAIVEWGSEPFGDGTGDPLGANVLGSGGANFDAFFAGNAGSGGGSSSNVVEALQSGTGCNAGVIAFVNVSMNDGWTMKFCDGSWVFWDGPGDNIGGMDIQGIAVHEYGHALGLGHSSVNGATMSPFTSSASSSTWRSIEADDIAGLQFIYGVKSASKPRIDAVSFAGGQVTITGVNFSTSGGEVWFTPDEATPAIEDPRVIVSNVSSTGGGTQIVVALPAGATSGNVAVKQNATGYATMSNAFPLDTGDDGGSDPDANFIASPMSGNIPLTVAFTDLSTGTGLTSWSWDFGDGGSSTATSPSHVYTTEGTFDVSLTVTGASGSSTEVQQDLIVVTGFVPASCTPNNGTGANPDILTCVTTPVLGSTWQGLVDGSTIGATGTSFLFGYLGPLPPVSTTFGELLIDPTSPFGVISGSFFFGGSASHAEAIPNDPGLNATQLYLQGYIPVLRQLTNRQDLVIGI